MAPNNIVTAEEKEEIKEHLDFIREANPARLAAVLKTTIHLTHQQDFMRNLEQVMSIYADTNIVDGRNEASVDFCKKVSDLRHYFPVI